MIPRLILTTGEPAGVGPDVVLEAAMSDWPAELLAVGCRKTLAQRADQLGLKVVLTDYNSTKKKLPHQAGCLPLIDLPLSSECVPGMLDTGNVSQVIAQLELATELCRVGECDGMVTGPVHKGVINSAGVSFSGHTEFLALATGADHPVMLLMAGDLKIALATTHLPLRAVPDAITAASLEKTLRALDQGLRSMLGVQNPRLTVLGLNPHAGEDGHLGREEIDIIEPVCRTLQAQGLDITGPISGDTAFNAQCRATTDAYLAMFHDQGLPIIKSEGFGGIVNVTLGLPIIRTSVDHGTALSLAGTGKANADSMKAAIAGALTMAQTRPEGSSAHFG